MVDRADDGSFVYDSLVLIDFDNSAWGYRAWDIVYFFCKWPKFPTLAEIEDFASVYLQEFNDHGNTVVTVDKFVLEIRHHEPYALIQNMLFYETFEIDGKVIGIADSNVKEYCDLMINYFERPGNWILLTNYLGNNLK